MEVLGITSVTVLTIICYLVAEGVKKTPLDNKWLPVVSGVCGGILGIVAMFVMPEYPAEDILTAIAVGIVSGLAATGADQISKQLSVNATKK